MPRRRSSAKRPKASTRRSSSSAAAADHDDIREGGGDDDVEEQEPQQQQPPRRSVAANVRDRQRAVAEREAARLARPEARVTSTLAHADRKKSAVTSTPFGVLPGRHRLPQQQQQPGGRGRAVGSGGGGGGMDDEEWCGPFSVARQMIAERDRAAKAAEEAANAEAADHPLDDVMLQLEHDRKRKQHPSIQWKSGGHLNTSSTTATTTTAGSRRQESVYAKRQRRANVQAQLHKIPSLFQTCIQFLVENIDAVESLGQGVDSSIRTKIAHQLVSRQKLDATSLPAIIEPGMDSLHLVDCSSIPQTTLSTSLQTLLPSGLKFLSLDQAGRCFGPQVVQDLIKSTTTTTSSSSSSACQLAGLAIGGAYLLKDEDAAALIDALKATLVSLEFKACPLLGIQLCRTLADVGTSLLELSLQDLTFSPEAWAALLSEPPSTNTTTTTTTSRALGRLESLRLHQMTGLTDTMVAQLLQRCGKSLQRLDLSQNHDLTDSTLAAIRQYCCCGSAGSNSNGDDNKSSGSSRLRHLSLCNLKLLTHEGLQALFTRVVVQPQGDYAISDDDAIGVSVSLPPRLESLDLGRCDYQAVTDELIDLVTQAAIANTNTTTTTAKEDGSDDGPAKKVVPEHKNTVGGLVRLSIQGSSLVTDSSLEYLAATCADTLQELNVSFCGRISNQGLGYLVDSCHAHVLRKLHVWGCAQLSDTFFDGHSRVNDAHLEILGAWIKSKQQDTIISTVAGVASASPL